MLRDEILVNLQGTPVPRAQLLDVTYKTVNLYSVPIKQIRDIHIFDIFFWYSFLAFSR